MIFETDKFKFDSNQTVKIEFTNGFTILVKCYNTDCSIDSGMYDEYTNRQHVNIDDAEQTVVNLIKKNVDLKHDRLITFARSKTSKSQYKSIMEKFIE